MPVKTFLAPIFLFFFILQANSLDFAKMPYHLLQKRDVHIIFEMYESYPFIGLSKMEREKNVIRIFSNGEVFDLQSKIQFKTSQNKVEAFLEQLKSIGFFDDKNVKRREWVAPDAEFTIIMATYKNKNRKLVSWHEIYERNPNIVVTDHGVERLDGRNRSKVLETCSPQYKRFRKLWADVEMLVEEFLRDAASESATL